MMPEITLWKSNRSMSRRILLNSLSSAFVFSFFPPSFFPALQIAQIRSMRASTSCAEVMECLL